MLEKRCFNWDEKTCARVQKKKMSDMQHQSWPASASFLVQYSRWKKNTYRESTVTLWTHLCDRVPANCFEGENKWLFMNEWHTQLHTSKQISPQIWPQTRVNEWMSTTRVYACAQILKSKDFCLFVCFCFATVKTTTSRDLLFSNIKRKSGHKLVSPSQMSDYVSHWENTGCRLWFAFNGC